ncbi:MAG: acyl-CoA dehydratase activase-related protein [Coriobacteriia bacterium]|nr:acyl-CoA dehydratase activase-related protein [Coriobacteriia bacterium]
MVYRLGIDAGSKTIKLVLLDDKGETVFSQYALHRCDIITTMKDLLHNTLWRFGDATVTVCITGSAGVHLAELLEVPHVQEVISTRHALEQLIPQADVAIELGGEDAKILYLSNGVEQRMNGSCAGGTGGFIDQMTTMLGVHAREFNSLALGYRTLYPIASRCAVFAQTDVRPLLNEGARREDVAASILQAVVTQTIAGLAWGRPIQGTVVFIGGPFEVYSELVSRFKQTLRLTQGQTIKPKDAHLFVAKGAALLSTGDLTGRLSSLAGLSEKLSTVDLEQTDGSAHLAPLFTSEAELEEFRQRHAKDRLPRARLMDAKGDVFISIDAGSTTVKLAAVNAAGELLFSSYEKSNGDVLEAARSMLEDLYRSLPCEYGGDSLVTLRHVKVTGYGERLLQVALQADSGVVETVAHLRAAQALVPDVDFVLDIGGLDIKCMRIKDGAIDDIKLNESCSSGCGALIEGFSRSLGHTKWSFSDIALTARNPVDLGTRCTVFMTSRVRHAQKEGYPVADIAAGLAYSVVRNALYKVIGSADSRALGRHVVVQGGTFKSDAVLRAFELECGLKVVRPDRTELMGAYGAALLARDEYLVEVADTQKERQSSLLTPFELATLARKQSTRRCEGCENNCLLTINDFGPYAESERRAGAPLTGRRLISGNRCERMGAEGKSDSEQPNLFTFERELLFAQDEGSAVHKETRTLSIGIPTVLDLFETYPFWQSLFTSLGMRVIRADLPSSEAYRKGAHAVLSEGSCFASKLVHGHVAQLLEQGVDFIFLPTGGAVASAQGGVYKAGSCLTIECPVSSNYAQLIAADVADAGSNVGFLTCDLASQLPLARQLYERFVATGLAELLQVDEHRIVDALAQARHAQEHTFSLLADKTAETLALLTDQGRQGMVLAGHPYHVDVGLNHAVDRLLNSLGFPVLSATGLLALARREGRLPKLADDLVAATWTQPSALYQVAQLVAENSQLELIQLYSYGCGVDALSIGQVRELIEASGKLYTALKMDEMVDLAAIRIRLRSLVVALNGRERRTECNQSISGTAQRRSEKSSAPLILMPALAPRHAQAIRTVAREAGYQLELLDGITEADVRSGLRFCNNDLCYPMIAVAGQVMEALSCRPKTAPISVIVPQVCCGCRSIELEQILRRQLRSKTGRSAVEVIGIPSRHEPLTVPAWLATRIFEELEECDTGVLEGEGPPVGVLGNAALLYTPQLNNNILEQIREAGCTPYTPPLTELLRTNAPLEELIDGFVAKGIRDVIFLQSFGCLTGHIHGRGATKRLKKRYPQLNISFLDFDPGASEVNQTSRLKLALTITKERYDDNPQLHH